MAVAGWRTARMELTTHPKGFGTQPYRIYSYRRERKSGWKFRERVEALRMEVLPGGPEKGSSISLAPFSFPPWAPGGASQVSQKSFPPPRPPKPSSHHLPSLPSPHFFALPLPSLPPCLPSLTCFFLFQRRAEGNEQSTPCPPRLSGR